MSTQFEKNAKKQVARMNPEFIQRAIVKDNRDPSKMGRVKVWIEGSSSAEENKDGWITCDYCSPFAGRTAGSPNAESYADYPKSYGFWAVPPDLGSHVFVFFINGRIEKSYWFGGSFDHQMNHQVPGPQTSVVSSSTLDTPYPVVDFDRNTNSSDPTNLYVDVPLVDSLQLQNLLYDLEKGVPNRSARRQTPGTVYGMSSPRGNHFVLDDGFTAEEITAPSWDDDQDGYQNTEYGNPVNDTNKGQRRNEGIVLRTRSGAQILISESVGNIFIINRDGTSRIEMDADGHVTVLSDIDISLRAKRDLNFFAERDINMEALRNINSKVGNDSKLEVMNDTHNLHHGNVITDIDKNFRLYTKDSIRIKSDTTFSLNSIGKLKMSSSADISAKASTVRLDAGGGKLTLNNDVSVSNSVLVGGDVKTTTKSLNSHTHQHIDAHGNTITSKVGSGGAGSPNALEPDSPDAADDIIVQTFTPNKYEDVVDVNPDTPTAKRVAKDIGVRPDKSLTALCFIMPVSGSIKADGYWGKNISHASGFSDNAGWTINATGSVNAITDGYIRDKSAKHVVVDHKNGFMSVYRNLSSVPSFIVGDEIKGSSTIGTCSGDLIFEIRKSGSSLYGFNGSVDPGLFYFELTGTGISAKNKKLTINETTNPVCKITSRSEEQPSEVVKTADIESIISHMPLSGSLRKPSPKNVRKPKTSSKTKSFINGDISELVANNAPPIDWVVTATDSDLLNDLKQDEGSLEYQTAIRTFRNGRFHVYQDSLGYDTIGYGHLIKANENFSAGITESEANALLSQDTVASVNDAMSIAESYKMKIPREAQLVLVEMVFQLGRRNVLGFSNMLRALSKNEYTVAANEMRDSLWYTQTTARAERQAQRIQTV